MHKEKKMFKLKKNEAEARERILAFWQGKSMGRPALIAYAKNKDYTWQNWESGPMPRRQSDLIPSWHANDCRNRLNSNLYLAEAIPSVCMDYGRALVLLAVLVGGDYIYEGINPWIQPLEGVLDMKVPAFDPQHSIVKGLEACLDAIVEVVGDNGFISTPTQIDPLTTLSLLQLQSNLCISLLEEPEKVKAWTHDATTLFIDCYEHFYRYLAALGYTDTSAWLSVMSESRMEAVQCDFSVMLSPDMFNEFVVPDMKRITSYMDRSIWHHDGLVQFRFIEMIAALPKLKAIQWVFTKREHPSEHINELKRLRELGLSVYTNVHNINDAVYLTKKLGPDGLMIVLPTFEDEKDAFDAIAKIKAAV